LTNRGYTHKYFVDGTPTVGDAYINSGWKTVLVGGLNNGGQGIYALNITDPANFTEANPKYSSSTQNGVVMWEFSDANDKDMGFSYSQPLIVRTNNSNTAQRWVAVFGNGYNNTNSSTADTNVSLTGHAVLYVVDLATGALIKKIDTGVGTVAQPNGLASVTATDLDGNGVVETVYAGDLQGNLWKFDLSSSNVSSWDVAFKPSGVPTPLFVAKDASNNAQPITSQVRVVRGPGSTGAVILFGTGKFLEPVDQSSTATQSLYGIYDSGTAITNGRTNLRQQTIDKEVTQSGVKVRITSNNQIQTGDRGWYMDLLIPPTPGTAEGERMIANPRVRNGRALFVTVVPGSDPCVPGGKTRFTELDIFSGSRLDDPPFDVNGDGRVDDNDMIVITLPDGTKERYSASSIELDLNYGTSPGMIANDNTDVFYVTGEDPDTTPAPGTTPFITNDSLRGIRADPGPNAHGRQSWRQLR